MFSVCRLRLHTLGSHISLIPSPQCSRYIFQQRRLAWDLTSTRSDSQDFDPLSQAGTTRNVYVGNIPPSLPVTQLLQFVRFGPLQWIVFVPEKRAVYLSFLDKTKAAAFYKYAKERSKQPTIPKSHPFRYIPKEDPNFPWSFLNVRWAEDTPVPAWIEVAVRRSKATRRINISLRGEGWDTMNKPQLKELLASYGEVEHMHIERGRCAFVSFMSIANAKQALSMLFKNPRWKGRTMGYAKDRCDIENTSGTIDPTDGQRMVVLYNIHPGATAQHVCHAVSGGALHSVQLVPAQKNNGLAALVKFIDPLSAAAFYRVALEQEVIVRNQRVRPAWGIKYDPLPPHLAEEVEAGATRTLLIYDDLETVTSDKTLRTRLSEFGEVEHVYQNPAKNVILVSYTHISSAIRARNGLCGMPEYDTPNKVNFSRDRCDRPAGVSLDEFTGKTSKPPLRESYTPNQSDEFDYSLP